MGANIGLGILMVILGGLMEGTYATRMRFVPRRRWKHIRLACTGWPLLPIRAIGAETLSGAVIGEWCNTGAKPIRVMALCTTILLVAVVLGYANRLFAPGVSALSCSKGDY